MEMGPDTDLSTTFLDYLILFLAALPWLLLLTGLSA